MSALLDNLKNGNRGDCREILHKKTKRDAILAVLDLIEDLADEAPMNDFDEFPGIMANVRSLCEPL